MFFRYFPETVYNQKVVKDITKRVRFYDRIANDPYLFLPYTIKEEETPEEIAHFYYGSVDYTWLVYLSNNIIDPYYDWPMTQVNLDRYIMDNYETEANTTGIAVRDWSQNTLITDNIVYYENEEGDRVSPETALYDDTFVVDDWTPIRVYDFEFNRNEERRHIQLIDRSYAEQVRNELKSVMAI